MTTTRRAAPVTTSRNSIPSRPRRALAQKHHMARRPAGRRLVSGVERRGRRSGRRHGQRHEPKQDRGEGFLELQFYPDSFTTGCTSGGGFQVKHEADVYTACSPVWTIAKRKGQIIEPAAFNGMPQDAAGSGPFVMHALDIVDVHIWAPSPDAAYREAGHGRDQRGDVERACAQQSGDGPLTPAFSTQGSATRSTGGRRLGHTDGLRVRDRSLGPLRPQSRQVLYPLARPSAARSTTADWANQQPIRILNVTFGDGSHPRNWAVVSDTGGKAEVLGHSFVGPTTARSTAARSASTRWFSWDGRAFNYGVKYPNTVQRLGEANQFQQRPTCPADGVFPGHTYCDAIVGS